MKQNLLEVSNIYQSICIASITGRKRGLSVKKLKKDYHMKKRDIKSLINFLNSYDMAGDGLCFYYNVYKLTSNYTEDKNGLLFDELPEEDVEEIDLSEQDIDNEMYIRIQDSVMILQEKVKEGQVDITNASLLHSMQNEMNKIWKKISDIKIDPDYVVMKEEKAELQLGMQRNKMEWNMAAIKGNYVKMEYWGKFVEKETVLPLGMYYNQFLGQYICVYQDQENCCQEKALDEIKMVKRLDARHDSDVHFQIHDYLKSVRQEQMTLRVYKEGNVAVKLRRLLAGYHLEVEEGEQYDRFIFQTDQPSQYIKLLKSYGRSVIVEKPDNIRKEMEQSTKEALEFYQQMIRLGEL